MHKRLRWLLTAVSVVGLSALGLPGGPAVATHNADDHSANLSLVKTLPKTGVTNSDLAFWGNRAYAGYLGGTVGGFRIIDISNPANATVITDFSCPGSQNDVSVWSNDADPAADLLFLSVDAPRSGTGCTGTTPTRVGPTFATDPNEWEGVRIFDINNETAPVQIAAVPTDCGSHTHTLVPGKGANAGNLYIYVSSYPSSKGAVTTDLPGGLRNNGTECVEPEPAGPGIADAGGIGKAHNKISIITVPLSNPAAAATAVGTGTATTYPNVKEFQLDGGTRWTDRTGTDGFGGIRGYNFTSCHDIAVFVEPNLAAGACWDEGQLWDISDPLTPDLLRRFRLDVVSDLYHSATFTWDAQIVAFEDEAGGGVDDRCRSVDDLQGRMYFYGVESDLLGTFKIPRPQPKGEVCTAHNYNYVPQSIFPRDILVSAWYQGGTSVIDTTNPFNAKEIAYYEAHTPVPGGTTAVNSDVWSSYWYNGFIYANDISRGLDIFRLDDRRVENAVTLARLNPQTQENLISQTQPRCRGQAATMLGTSGPDTLTGTEFTDVIVGLGGNDTIRGLGARDFICGGGGKDKIVGGGGSDRLSGNAGADRISGGPGGDNLNGGPGRDRCNGGPAADRLRSCEVIVGSR
jgi:hypothetical protein